MNLDLGTTRFDITHRAVVMGILNRTPDSFYDQGSYYAFDDFLRRPSSWFLMVQISSMSAG